MFSTEWTNKDSLGNSILNKPKFGDVPPYTPGDIPVPAWGQQGWICPKCGRVNGPHVDTCPCSKPSDNYATTNFTPKPYWDYLSKSYSTNINPEEAKEWFDKYVKEVKQSSVEELTEEEKQELLKKFDWSATTMSCMYSNE